MRLGFDAPTVSSQPPLQSRLRLNPSALTFACEAREAVAHPVVVAKHAALVHTQRSARLALLQLQHSETARPVVFHDAHLPVELDEEGSCSASYHAQKRTILAHTTKPRQAAQAATGSAGSTASI